MEKRIALLIDAENTSVKYLDSIFMELRNYGTVTYKRMYGDFTSETLSAWNHRALSYAVVPIQQPRYSTAKNAADIMLVIDAMDILYTKNVDVFCIVSSDSDFTRLVNRLCDGGMEVIGMGKSDASKTLKAACTIYKNLEIIYGDSDELETAGHRNDVAVIRHSKSDSDKAETVGHRNAEVSHKETVEHQNVEGEHKETDIERNIVPLPTIKKSMIEIVRENENQGNRTNLGGLKSSIQRLYKDFDERNYGYSSMTKLLKELNDFAITQERTSVYVALNKQNQNERSIEAYIIELARKSPIDLGRLGQYIHQKFPEFDVKQYGYSRLGTFVQSINGVVVEASPKGRTRVRCL